MALVFWASLRRLAIFCLILFILTLCSDLVPAMALVGSAGGILTTGAAPADGLGGIAAGGGGAAGSAGAAAAGLALGAPPAPSFSFRSLVPGDTVAPSSTRSSSITPAAGEGTGTLVLSVSISQR